MGDLSEHFSESEFCCKGEDCCGHSAPIHPMMVQVLEYIRDVICIRLERDTPLKIVSGFRCRKYNSHIPGAAKNSRHSHGDAVDIACPPGVSPQLLAVYARVARVHYGLEGGIGIYDNWVHMDFRGTSVQWDHRKQ